MTRPKITPGPWRIEFANCVYGTDGPPVIWEHDIHCRETSENRTNLKAIAAVPDMMDALERCFRRFQAEDGDGRLGHSIEYLIVKDALIKAGYTF